MLFTRLRIAEGRIYAAENRLSYTEAKMMNGAKLSTENMDEITALQDRVMSAEKEIAVIKAKFDSMENKRSNDNEDINAI